jgi:hypothetical protein
VVYCPSVVHLHLISSSDSVALRAVPTRYLQQFLFSLTPLPPQQKLNAAHSPTKKEKENRTNRFSKEKRSRLWHRCTRKPAKSRWGETTPSQEQHPDPVRCNQALTTASSTSSEDASFGTVRLVDGEQSRAGAFRAPGDELGRGGSMADGRDKLGKPGARAPR